MSDDNKQSDGPAEELIAWQQAGEEQAQQRYRQVREQLEKLTQHLGLINDVKQTEQLLAEQKEMNEAHAIVREALNEQLLRPTNAEGVSGHVSALNYTIDRTNNVATTETLLSDVAIRPLGYAKFINTTLGYSLTV